MTNVGTISNGRVGRDLLRMVSQGLENRGFRVCLPEQDDRYELTIDVAGAICDLHIDDDGSIEWGCGAQDGHSADPRRTADLAAFLLTGRAQGHPEHDHESYHPDITFKGIVGLQAKAKGLNVELTVHEDEKLYDATAEITITNPASRSAGTVRVTDYGSILWEQDSWDEISSKGAASVADFIINRIAPVISLAQVTFTGGG